MVLRKSLEGSRQLSALPGASYKEKLCGETVRFCTKRTTTPTTGTVFFESGSSFSYWNDIDKTRASRSKQGWWTYGDIGHVDEDGYLYLSDRRDFTIISGGVNIYPQEIEHALVSDSRVLDVAVFGIPNIEFGETTHAVIQVANLPADADAFADELRDLCRRELGSIRIPKSFSFVLEFPRLPTGKLQKKALRESYLASVGFRGLSR